jgi:hypothetical protein
MQALELSADIPTSTARAAARRELRVVKAALAAGDPIHGLWLETYIPHQLYLRQFLGAGHCESLRYVSDRFAHLCARGMPCDETFIAEAARDIRSLIPENT